MADSYQNNWGPEVGSQIALLAAKDQNGDVQQLKDLAGSQGVLIFYNRSADW
jgi:peroxiredoxin